MLNALSNNALVNMMFEQDTDFLGVYDAQQDKYIRINQAGVGMMGYLSEQQLLDLPKPSFRSQSLSSNERSQTIAKMIQAGHYDEEVELIRYGGDTFWGRLSISAIEPGQLSLVRITNLDRLRRTERELAHSVHQYEAIFSNATIGIIVCNDRGRIVSANQLADQLFGYATGEMVSMAIEQLVPSSVSHYHEKLRQSFNANPQVRAMGHNRDLHAQRKDGSVFPVEISLSYFRLADELHVVAYIIDISYKKEVERELLFRNEHIERLNADLEQKVIDRTHALMHTLDQLERSKDELSKALAAERELGELKSRFVSMASHEFRTPLTAVQTSATLIEKYPGGDQQDKRQKHINRIRSSVKQLNDILEEFLSVGRLEEGKIEAHPVAIAVPRLVEEVVADMKGAAKANQTIQIDVSCPHPAWLDPSLLRKVLINLLSNALKYSPLGSTVTIAGSCANGQLVLSIRDQGIGISQEDKEHLFDRFFRGHNVANIPGTGLGLHIVARYIDLMGGTLALQSELNQGTTVTLTLPYENHTVD
ncbi:MAG: sensor signal transduction histidine kinase [Spirosoma sp.]|nr:sensor signal transduction histidine kinase [Spirosoma sp.]